MVRSRASRPASGHGRISRLPRNPYNFSSLPVTDDPSDRVKAMARQTVVNYLEQGDDRDLVLAMLDL